MDQILYITGILLLPTHTYTIYFCSYTWFTSNFYFSLCAIFSEVRILVVVFSLFNLHVSMVYACVKIFTGVSLSLAIAIKKFYNLVITLSTSSERGFES